MAESTLNALPHRAAVAQLTLRLRQALEEAASAEAEVASIDNESAVVKLRAELDAQLVERRRSLEAALTQARGDALAPSTHNGNGSPAHFLPALQLVESRVTANEIVTAPQVVSVVDTSASSPQQLTHQQSINLVIDAESFAEVLANVLGKHLAGVNVGAHPALPPALPKPSLWSLARHLDVVLIGLASLIVIVIFAAWLG
jgi:hypothetical protein